jgi:hypothetical protein
VRRAAVIATLAALASACGPATKNAALVDARPDLSGWWIWDHLATKDFPVSGLVNQRYPFKPEILAAKPDPLTQKFLAVVTRLQSPEGPSAEDEAALEAIISGNRVCTVPQFIGVLASEATLEFLSTPGRVTILDEGGLVRRVALDQSLPHDVVESNPGTSAGHWEGKTLVVESTGFNSEATINGQKIGRNASSVERISLKEPDVMQVEVKMTVPDLFSAPFEHTYIFRRDPGHQFSEIGCTPYDPSIDPVKHKERFEPRPPTDLPPPPQN